MQEQMTVSQVAEKEKVSVARIHFLLKQGRVEGAKRYGDGRGFWLIPVNEEGRATIKGPPIKKRRKFQKISNL